MGPRRGFLVHPGGDGPGIAGISAGRPMTFRHRMLGMIAATVLTLALIGVALWFLLRVLAVRDCLGRWHLVLFDDHGARIGHGDITLVATRWSVAWSRAYPYVHFVPDLATVDSTFHFDEPGVRYLESDYPGIWPADYAVLQPEYILDDGNTQEFSITGYADGNAANRKSFTLELDLDQGNRNGASCLQYRCGILCAAVNFPTTATR